METRPIATLLRAFFRSIARYHDSHTGESWRAAPVPCEPGAVAEACANKLLLRVLTPQQRQEIERNGYFAVEVAGRGKFVILASAMFNVLHITTGLCYCAVPRTAVPMADLMLAQKLLLENDPDQFFKVANCRHELVVGLTDERLLPGQVLRARNTPRNPRVRCSEISMIPHEGHLP